MQDLIIKKHIKGLTLRSLGLYEGELGLALRRLKFKDETHLARKLAKRLRVALPSSLLFQHLRPSRPRVALIPVPLSPQRLVERGYNQSALIAAQLSRGTSLQLNVHSASRPKETLRQSDLSRQARQDNLENAFAVKSSKLRDQPVILLDDVATTGATLLSLAHTLEQRHFRVLSAITIAYANDRK